MESNPHTHVLVCVLTHTRSPLYASQSLSPSNTSNLAHPPVSSLAFFPLCFPFPPSTLILLLSSFSPSFRHLCGGCGDKQRSYLSIYQNGWHSMADTHQVCPCVCVCVCVCLRCMGMFPRRYCAGLARSVAIKIWQYSFVKTRPPKYGVIHLCVCPGCKSHKYTSDTHTHWNTKWTHHRHFEKVTLYFSIYYTVYNILPL